MPFGIAHDTVSEKVVQYHQTSNTSHSLVDNNLADQSDAIGASSVGAAPTTSSFST